MKRPWLWTIALLELVLLIAYFRVTGLAQTPQAWLASFTWNPYHGTVDTGRLIGVWGLALSGILIASVWVGLAAGAGAAGLAALGFQAETALQDTLLSAGLGLGGLALAVFFLALFKAVTPLSALGLGALLFAVNAARWRRLLIARPRAGWLASEEGEPIAVALVIASALLVFHLIGALVPPSGFDEMDYQLSLPKLYLLDGGFVPTPFSHFSFIPKNVNMLFLLGLVSGGTTAAKVFALALSLCAALTLYAFAKPRLGPAAAALGALLYYFTPVIGNQFRVAAPDMGTAFFELLGLFLLLRWLEKPRTVEILLAGVYWGLALGSKYTAFPDFAACALALLWLSRRGLRTRGKDLVVFAACAGFVVSPWLLKNWIETGNPFNPLFSTRIKSTNFYFAGQYRATVDYAKGLGIEDYFPLKTPLDLLLLPWRVVTGHNDYNHDLGPAWLMLAPLSLLSLKRRAPAWLRWAMVFAGAYWLFWLCGSIHMTRYFTAGLALAALGAGWLLDAPDIKDLRWALLLPVLVSWFQQSARMVQIQNFYKKPWAYLAGAAPVGDYLEAVQTDCPFDAIEYINETAPKDARVLVFNEFRTFYLDRDFLASTPWDHDYWLEMLRTSKSPEELLARLKARRITHFLANDSFRNHQTGMPRADEWTPEDLALEKKWLLRVMRPVYKGGEGAWVAVIRDKVEYPHRRN